jgi:O-antigen/teichoic acid export membrane protein
MAKGAAWLVLFRLTERSIGFVSTLILARVLVPADFGLVAMATSLLAALDLLHAFSFDLALIQNQQAQRHHYDTAWTFAVLFGILKSLALCLLAVPAARFFAEPRLGPLVYALALYTLIEGFDNIGIVAFQKDLELHKEFWFGLAKKLVGFAVTVPLAFWLRSYWALMAGILSARLTSLLLSYWMHPFRPRFSLGGARDLFNFSKWLLLNNFLIFVNNRGTDFVIGKLSGARALGLYSISYEIANLPTTELVWPISRAVFPGYARMANDLPRLREAFLQVISLVALFTVPAGIAIALVAESLVQVLLGAKWSDAVPLIQVLAVFGVVRSLHGPMGSIYLALGKPRFVAGFQCVQIGVAITLMLLLVPRYGTIGAAYALLAGASLAMSVNYIFALRELQMPVAELVRALWRPIVGAAAMAAAVGAIGSLWPGENGAVTNVLRLGALCTVAAVSYVVVVLLCWWLARRPEGPESQIVRFGVSRLGSRA